MNSCDTAAAGPGEQNRPLQQWKHWHATDTLEVPLLKEEIRVIWQEQKQHVACLQDPHGIELHTSVEHMEKGGIRLPVFHCARGITSLESFHLRLARFNPGTSASAVIFQAFLVDGLVRWNRARAMAAHEGQGSMSEHLTYNSNINCTTFPFLKMLFAGTVKGSTALQQMKPASKVRLDIWHYVELVVSCTSKSHPLFMVYISM